MRLPISFHAPSSRVEIAPRRLPDATVDRAVFAPVDGGPVDAFAGRTSRAVGHRCGVAALVPPALAVERPLFAEVRTRAEMSREAEDAIVAERGHGVLASYGPFDPRREPVILVHGFYSSPAAFADMANVLRNEGRQVFFFFYDDHDRSCQQSGIELANAMRELRSAYGATPPRLSIIGHSMGGLVTRAAANSLEQPDWLPSEPCATAVASRHAGFAELQLRLLDSPWYGGIPPLDEINTRMMRVFEPALVDMGIGSAFLSHVFSVPLPGVTIELLAAEQAEGAADRIVWATDLPCDELRRLVDHLIAGSYPELGSGLRSLCAALYSDHRQGRLRVRLRQLEDSGGMAGDATEVRQRILAIFDEVMRPMIGTHHDIITDPLAIRRVVDSLSPRSPAAP